MPFPQEAAELAAAQGVTVPPNALLRNRALLDERTAHLARLSPSLD